MYNVDYFIQKFEAIPETNWCTGKFERDGGKYCAAGHCGKRDESCLNNETASLIKILSPLKLTKESWVTNYCNKLYDVVAAINDGHCLEYRQGTPKQRILAALHDAKKLQQPVYENITKQLAELPIQPETSDLEFSKIMHE